MPNASVMDEVSQQLIREATGAKRVVDTENIQSLWSGYGQIFRAHLQGGTHQSVIVKRIQPPTTENHPRGWASQTAFARKRKSYQVELHWYRHWSRDCPGRVPQCYASHERGEQVWLVLEDMDSSGYALRHDTLSVDQCRPVLHWLAEMHAGFLGRDVEQLWDTGTYWHLATRPDELAAMPAGELRQAAPAIDGILSECRFQTILHGDAKVANFCFQPGGDVAAVDFQYTGRGCGMKDVAYFLGSCLTDNDLERHATGLLDDYFETLCSLLGTADTTAELEREWRAMFPLAWTDFYRFISGWMPGHKKINRYTRALAEQCLALPNVRQRANLN